MARHKRRKRRTKNNTSRRSIFALIVLLIGLLMLVALVTHNGIDDARITGELDANRSPFSLDYRNQGGLIGAYLAYFSFTIIGWLAFFIPFGLILISARLFSKKAFEQFEVNGFLVFVVSLVGTMIYNIHLVAARELEMNTDYAGGIIAEKLTGLSVQVVGETGSYIVLTGLVVILIALYTSINPFFAMQIKLPRNLNLRERYLKAFGPIKEFLSLQWAADLFSRDKDDDGEEGSDDLAPDDIEEFDEQPDDGALDEPAEEAPGRKRASRKTTIHKKAEKVQVGDIDYEYPSLDLLSENPHSSSAVKDDELKFTARMLSDTLETFNVKIDGEIETHPGPVITRYEFKPGTGIKVNQVINLSDDLALALKAKRIRIIAPIPGKAAVGIEIPNRNPQMVYARDIIGSQAYIDANQRLPLALGKTISGDPFVVDLAKMPHLLIAGATGSGKSVCVNVLITSLIYRLHPHQVRFIFIDPKMLELSVYAGIPHMARPVVTNPKRAERVLSDAVAEMEARYRKLANAGVRNIVDFNDKQEVVEKKLPYLVIVVDELADLMMSATSTKVETLITRLAQMSRAVGIHLMLATQRPSVDVITGLIKANFPARIAFQVSSKVDSRTIIDANGAEKLLGNGDMLFLAPGQPEPVRVHGAWLSSDESTAIIEFIKAQEIPMLTMESISQGTGEVSDADDVDLNDPLFKEACQVVVQQRQGSVSLLQRRLGIGYQRAARMIDKLEQAGIVSPFDGSKAREVLVDQTYLDTLFTQSDDEVETSQQSN